MVLGKVPGYDQLATSPVYYATSTLDMASNVARNRKPSSSLMLARLKEKEREREGGFRGTSVNVGGWLAGWLFGWLVG